MSHPSEQPVGAGACLRQRPTRLSLFCTTTGTHRRESVYGDGPTDFRWNSAVTHLVPIAFFRLSVLCRDLLRLDLDALEGLTGYQIRGDEGVVGRVGVEPTAR